MLRATRSRRIGSVLALLLLGFAAQSALAREVAIRGLRPLLGMPRPRTVPRRDGPAFLRFRDPRQGCVAGPLAIPSRAEAASAYIYPYQWRHGCTPTSAGMVFGYWDTNGFPDLIPGDPSSQTGAVNDVIANQQHYDDYSLPLDDPGSILADKSELGGAHGSNCTADFMHTSWSLHEISYGGTAILTDQSAQWGGAYGMKALTAFASSNYWADAWAEYWSGDINAAWEEYKAEINAGDPVVLNVDSNGDGNCDHSVCAWGYDDSGGVWRYKYFNTWDNDVHESDFAPLANGQAWGVWGAILYHPHIASDDAVFKAAPGDAGSPDLATDIFYIRPGQSRDYPFFCFNRGTTTWPGGDDYYMHHNGHQLGLGPVLDDEQVGSTTAPGSFWEKPLGLVGPPTEGTYTLTVQMVHPRGTEFGAKIDVAVVVDGTPPDESQVAFDPAGSTVVGTKVHCAVTCSDTLSGIDHFRLAIRREDAPGGDGCDPSAWRILPDVTGSSGVVEWDTHGWDATQYHVHVDTYDRAGNASSPCLHYELVPPRPRYQPDVVVRDISGGPDMGDGVYEATPVAQVVHSRCSRPGKLYFLRVDNDGARRDAVTVTGTRGTRAWEVRYYDSWTAGHEVTGRVTAASGWRVPRVVSDGCLRLRVEVTPSRGTAVGATNTVFVLATSGGDPVGARDVVKLVTALRGATGASAAAGAPQVDGLTCAPANRGVQLAFTLSAPATVQARVLNMAGRSIRTICHNQACEAGANTLLWNAQSDAGLAVPSGNYLIEVIARGDDGSQSRALATVRINR